MRRLAIIPARGGSKRIPGKNIKLFHGKPLISYSIEAAVQSNLFDRVIVSTDSHEIKQVSESWGGQVPFFRSSQNSNDFATTADVVAEVILELKKSGEVFDLVCCIYPTAPFLLGETLIRACRSFEESNTDSMISVVPFGYPIQRALKATDNMLEMVNPEYLNTRSQDLEPMYHDAGQFYWVKESVFNLEKKLLTRKCSPFVLPETEVQDIDTPIDWQIAELKFLLKKRTI